MNVNSHLLKSSKLKCNLRKKYSIVYSFVWLAALLTSSFAATASGEGDHTHATEKSFASANQKPYFSIEAASEKHELLLRYEPIHPGEEATLTLFASDFYSNEALDSITWNLSSPQDADMKFMVVQTREGVYQIKAIFKEKKNYTLTLQFLSSLGPDLIALQPIEVGRELALLEEADAASLLFNPFLLFSSGLLLGVFLMFLLTKYAGIRTKATLLLLVMFLPIIQAEQTFAHEGHGENEKKGNNLSNAFEVPKETQFLFEAQTHRLERGAFSASTKLFGTIIPSSNGQSIIQAPQTGKLASLLVHVGQKVQRGQTLAVLEQSLDAATQTSIATERNNATAELEAATKDYERLQSIADIAAKRDVSEAKARYEKAVDNKKLFDDLLNGKVDASKLITLKAPISGVVGNFTYTVGSSVNAGEVIFTITNLSSVYAEAQVYDKDADLVNMAKTFVVECTTDDHKTANVRLLVKAQSINTSNQSQRVLFEMDNTEEDFKIGEFVNIRVFVENKSRELTLPNSAISEINGRPVVFIKDAAENFSVSYVSLGHDNGTSTIILRGAEEGERIITQATYQLKMIYLNQ